MRKNTRIHASRVAAVITAAFLTVLCLPAFAQPLTKGNAARIVGGAEYATVQAAIEAAGSGQTVQLLTDSTENLTIGSVSVDVKIVTLDLNGHTLTGAGNASVICNFRGILTLKDSGGGGRITGGNGTLRGGLRNGGGVNNYGDSTFIMEGGTITGNHVKGVGGGVNNVGTFHMKGGVITGNSATIVGGAVYNDGKGTFIMEGGVITGNIAPSNGGGVMMSGTMTVSGAVSITGNKNSAEAGAADSNVYLPSGKTLTVAAAGLSRGATIGVTTQTVPTSAAPVPVTGDNTADYRLNFTGDLGYCAINEGSGSKQHTALSSHIHSWSYELAKTTSDNDTLKAVCGGADTCPNTDTALTVRAPELSVYGASGSEKASLSAGTLCGTAFSESSIRYYAKGIGGSYGAAEELAPTGAGAFKAAITAGGKTAFVEYTIEKAQQPETVGQIIEKSRTSSSITVTVTNTRLPAEFAISEVNTPPADGWRDSGTFTGLRAGLRYYVFARVKESQNYLAGSAASLAASAPVPETGDGAPFEVWLALCAASLLLTVTLILKSRSASARRE